MNTDKYTDTGLRGETLVIKDSCSFAEAMTAESSVQLPGLKHFCHTAAGTVILAVTMIFLLHFPARATSLQYVMELHKDEIITECREYGIWPSAVVGMAGVESGFSSISQLASVHNNYWGLSYSSIIARYVPTSGSVYGGFASYPTFSDGLHAYLIWFWQGVYPGVASVLKNLNSTPEAMYSAVVASGYMTGTAGYYEGIVQFAHAVGADEWDDLAFPHGRKYVPYIEGMPDSEEIGSYNYPDDIYNTHKSVIRLLSELPTDTNDSIETGNISSELLPLEGETGRLRTDIIDDVDDERKPLSFDNR